MPFPIAPQLHHPMHMGQHQHPHNMQLLQAVTQMRHQPHTGLNALPQHPSGLDYMGQHGPVDPHQHLQALQQGDLSDQIPRRKNRKRDELDAGK